MAVTMKVNSLKASLKVKVKSTGPTEICTLASGFNASVTAMESTTSLMAADTRVTPGTVNMMVRELTGLLMEASMKDNGYVTKGMAMASLITLTEIDTMVNGKTTKDMEKEFKFMLAVQRTKENTRMT